MWRDDVGKCAWVWEMRWGRGRGGGKRVVGEEGEGELGMEGRRGGEGSVERGSARTKLDYRFPIYRSRRSLERVDGIFTITV